MTGRTHIFVGAAAALALVGAPATLPSCAIAAAGGAAGAVLPDLDVRDTAHPLRDRLARVAAAALLSLAVALDATHGATLLAAATSRGLGAVALGAVALVGLACAARLSAHRSFSHSLLALAGFSAAAWLACPPLALPVGVGFATHLALDALNHRPVRLLWPLRGGLRLGVCRTGGIVDACLLVAAIVTIAAQLCQACAPALPLQVRALF